MKMKTIRVGRYILTKYDDDDQESIYRRHCQDLEKDGYRLMASITSLKIGYGICLYVVVNREDDKGNAA